MRNHMTRTRLAVTGLAIVMLAACTSASGSPNTRANARPNIIFVLTDDLDLMTLQNTARFPVFNQLMTEAGITFSNYFVTDSLCCPSRASIFTGEFPATAACSATSSPMAAMAGSTPTAMRPAPSQLRCSAAAIGLGCSANI